MERIAIVTGGSSGIGLECARFLRSQDCIVYTISRRAFTESGLNHIAADVTSEKAMQEAVRSVMDREGRIDILVNAAGFGISGAIEFTDLEDAKRQLEVNFFGLCNSVKAVLPYMRKQRSGRIVNISSMASGVGIPFQGFYSASKAAIDSYTLALRNEVRPFGISVSAVRPGDIATGFTAARKKSPEGDAEYCGRISESVGKMEKDEQCGMDASKAGRRIGRIALRKSGKPFYTIDALSFAEHLLVKFLPARTVNWIAYRLYG